MLQNAYLLAKIGADTAENEQHFAEKLPKVGNHPTGPRLGPGLRCGLRREARGELELRELPPTRALRLAAGCEKGLAKFGINVILKVSRISQSYKEC